MPDNGNKLSRREVLKSMGVAGTAVSGFSLTANASTPSDPPADELEAYYDAIEKALELRQKTKKQSVFENYLRAKGYPVVSNTHTETMSLSSSSNDVSTSELYPRDNAEFTQTISITAKHIGCDVDPADIYVDYSFEWDVDKGSGEPAKDSFAVGWEDDLELESKSYRSSDNVTQPETHGLNGFSFKYDDSSNIGSAPAYDHGYGGWHLKPPSSEDYDNDTTFYGKWTHTYQDMTVTGWSTGPDGIWPEFGNEGKETTSYQIQEDYSEADHEWNNC